MSKYRNQQGYTLTDIVIFVLIAGIVASASLKSLFASYTLTNMNNYRVAAINLAQEKIEELRDIEYFRIHSRPLSRLGYINTFVVGTDDTFNLDEDILLSQEVVLDDSATEDPEDDMVAMMNVYVEYVDEALDGVGNKDTVGTARDHKKVTVEVSWSVLTVPQTERITTYFSGSDGFDIETLPDEADEPDELKDIQKKSKQDKPKGKKKKSKAEDEHVPDSTGD
jgi:hypothetical protein